MVTEETAQEICSDPALLFLARRTEEMLGIKAAPDALCRLREYLEERNGVYTGDFAAYSELLSSPEELGAITRILTVNETYFFREPAHFKLLIRRLLPEFAKLSRPVRICSAATSSGCEAYSIAMVIDFYARGKDLFISKTDSAAMNPGFDYQIDAFDINPHVIEIARNGRYTGNVLREDGAEWHFIMDLYLKRNGEEYEIAQPLRNKVRFFTHNIMDGITGSYDLIFFRNALIYFSWEKRRKIMDYLAGALTDGGILIPGVSESSSVEHPLLESRHTMEAFYFQKKKTALPLALPFPNAGDQTPQPFTPPEPPPPPARQDKQAEGIPATSLETAAFPVRHERKQPAVKKRETAPASKSAASTNRRAAPVNMEVITALLENGEGRPNAEKAEGLLQDGETAAQTLTEGELIAAAITFLGAEEFESAEKAVSFLERSSNPAAVSFLRGEYYYLTGNAGAAEEKYQEASLKDKAFWPAFYRICSLAAPGNRTRYEYKVKKTLESMEAGKDLRYESFIGGFSPDYYRRILERKLNG
ncbi:MAG: chemotaxis protein CheR [Treponema sp.]|jgi:chemotaxis protein methyltransferase CheR|nr:chemotaxis protein CheR [Treponema sp.]